MTALDGTMGVGGLEGIEGGHAAGVARHEGPRAPKAGVPGVEAGDGRSPAYDANTDKDEGLHGRALILGS